MLRENTLQAIEPSRVVGCIPSGYTRPVRTVGQNLAALREKRNLSQVELADRLKMRQPSVWKLENSKGLPESGTLLKLAKALPCTVGQLLEGVDTEYDKLARDLSRHPGTENGSTADGSHSPGVSDAHTATRVLEKVTSDYQRFAHEVSQIAESLTKLVDDQPERIKARHARKRTPHRGGRR
jgi:transcriptional regulator with XRE-family HTH domain